MLQKAFRRKRSSRKQSPSQTRCQLCKPSCLANLTTQNKLTVYLYCSSMDTSMKGNEMADQLEKKKGKRSNPITSAITIIHKKKKAIFHSKTGGYSPKQDALHQLPRHQQTTISHIRTGHCKLNSHLKRIGAKTLAQCPCGEANQTLELVCSSKPSSGGLQRICS